jgi:hypothetical protein
VNVPVGKCTPERLQLSLWHLSWCDRSVGHKWKRFDGNGPRECWSTSGSRYDYMMNGVLLHMFCVSRLTQILSVLNRGS